MIDDGHLEQVGSPKIGVRIQPFTSEEESLKLGYIMLLQKIPLGVFSLDRSYCSGSGKERLYVVLGYDTPELPGSGVPTGLPSNTMVVAPFNSGA